MLPTSPMTYEPLKCILQYMNPNLRISLTLRCPAVRTAEKSVPLSLDTVELAPFTTKINETEYKIGSIRHFKKGTQKNDNFELDAKNGGVEYDLDEHGVLDQSSEKEVLPGDLTLLKFCSRHSTIEYQREELLNFVANELKKAEKFSEVSDPKEFNLREYIHFRSTENSENSTIPFKKLGKFWGSRLKGDVYECDEGRILQVTNKNLTRGEFEKIQNEIQKLRDLLKSGLCSGQILFTVTSPDGKVEVKKLENTRKIHIAVKSLNGMLFGRRKMPIQIKNLKVHVGERNQGTIRLPENLKIHVENLEVGSGMEEYIDQFQRILSSPPKSISLVEYHSASPVIDSAQFLKIENFGGCIYLLRRIHTLSNREVHVNNAWMKAEIFGEVVENWMKNGKEIGTWWSFLINETDQISQNILNVMKEIPNRRVDKNESCSLFPHRITFPMSSSANLVVSSQKKDKGMPWKTWLLNLKVEENEL
ncbi:hypothetical protein CAEBREN_00083 [Caenorhabditis brenneri]|uniref:F-box C protein n=1 Tax=Caenorhabditis brenneri TaxID=135651 RepID=G0PI66_CAEBE|nr:hypothetical protein CAEBREN_00083 [Caenorhabditis brenneri]